MLSHSLTASFALQQLYFELGCFLGISSVQLFSELWHMRLPETWVQPESNSYSPCPHSSEGCLKHCSGSTLSPGSLMWPLLISSMSSHHSWPCTLCSHSNTEWPKSSVLSLYTPSTSSNLCFTQKCPLTALPAHSGPGDSYSYFPPPGSLLWCLWLGEVPLPITSCQSSSSSYCLWAIQTHYIDCRGYRRLSHHNEWALCSMQRRTLFTWAYHSHWDKLL